MQLVVVDTAQIQAYVFGSNRLRENVGASHLVSRATREWVLDSVRRTAPSSNVTVGGEIEPSRTLDLSGSGSEAQPLKAEVLYAAGGNAVVLFQGKTGQDKAAADQFTGHLTRHALRAAPGVQLAITQVVYDPAGPAPSLAAAVEGAFRQLAREKRAAPAPAPVLGLGVTMMCRSTGLPAVGITPPIGNPDDPNDPGDPGYPASAEVMAKVRAAMPREGQLSAADARLQDVVPAPQPYCYPREFEHLGRSLGERSYLAVVHADGDGIGMRVQALGRRYWRDNRGYVSQLRAFAAALEEAAVQALRATLDRLAERLDGDGDLIHHDTAGKELSRIELTPAGRDDPLGCRWRLPVRPLVFGGDDITFVCDGRLGLALAVEYLQQFERATAALPDGAGQATASAGVAIVKTHYPFARAYALAAELTHSAKTLRRAHRVKGSCLDWHFALSGLSGGIAEIRRREFTVRGAPLHLRPVAVSGSGRPHAQWAVVRSGIDAFQGEGWALRHNKAKALRDALRAGPEAVRWFRQKFNKSQSLPDVLPTYADWPATGWQGDGEGAACGYFDALELADWFVPLERRREDTRSNGQEDEA